MTQHSKQQTVISSQRRHTERCDLTCPHDSKNLSARTYAVSVYDTRELIRGKKISQNFPHYPHSTPLFLSSLPSFPFCSAHQPAAQRGLSLCLICLLYPSVFHYLNPSFLSLWTGRKLDFQERGDDTQLNVCRLDKNSKNKQAKLQPNMFFPQIIKEVPFCNRTVSKQWCPASCVSSKHGFIFTNKKKKQSAGPVWAVVDDHSPPCLLKSKSNVSIPVFFLTIRFWVQYKSISVFEHFGPYYFFLHL